MASMAEVSIPIMAKWHGLWRPGFMRRTYETEILHVTKAQARRMRRQMGVSSVEDLPPGPWVEVCLGDWGYRVVPTSHVRIQGKGRQTLADIMTKEKGVKSSRRAPPPPPRRRAPPPPPTRRRG